MTCRVCGLVVVCPARDQRFAGHEVVWRYDTPAGRGPWPYLLLHTAE